mmetsp:Transcript_15553/g.28225  ORF Transcript_15553/g.28225 Transcript_15553/m.28225 type:complete len:161 (-) Transcript_15553:612-1094(-)
MKLPINSAANINDEVRVACTSCSQVFKSKIALRRHLNLYHSNSLRFKCVDCGRVLSSRQNLSEHRNIHTGLKPYACNFEGCPMRFRQGSQLSVHKRIHKAIMLYRSKAEEGEALKLTDCLKATKLVEPVPSQVTISGWVKLPLITNKKPPTTLPSLHISF